MEVLGLRSTPTVLESFSERILEKADAKLSVVPLINAVFIERREV